MAAERKIKTTWGRVKVSYSRDGKHTQMLSYEISSRKTLISESETAIRFVENNMTGWKNQQGGIIFPALYEEIERGYNFVYLRTKERIAFIKFNGGISDRIIFENDIFMENGKMGWKQKGEVVIPAKFDELYKWGNGYDVFCTYDYTTQKYTYYNSKMEIVLADVPVFPEDDEQKEPYMQYANGKTFSIFECVESCDDDNSNVVCCKGNKVRVGRTSKSLVQKALIEENDVVPFSECDFIRFNSNYTYEITAFQAKKSGGNALQECLSAINEIGGMGGSWYYLMKVWTNSNTVITNDDLTAVYLDFSKKITFNFAYGRDEALKDGEVKVFIIRHFHDRWPCDFEFEYGRVCSESTLEEILSFLKKTYNEEFAEELISTDKELVQNAREVWNNLVLGTIYKVGKGSRSRTETLRVLEYFKGLGCPFDSIVIDKIEEICYSFAPLAGKTNSYVVAKWALQNGANPNGLFWGKSALDYVEEALGGDCKKGERDLLQKCKRLLLRYGAKSAADVKKEQDVAKIESMDDFLKKVQTLSGSDLWKLDFTNMKFEL
jgi:hypothetical protein